MHISDRGAQLWRSALVICVSMLVAVTTGCGSSDEGEETPGGDMSTPDQDVVEEIGRALGVEYEDAEELKGAEKIESRDRNRWEYDPASAEDYKDRNRRED